ncbi:hypothetical protein QUF72_01250 [Desulfobacterales bacterium HSG2]|nr:hypothetical protein [Desulfobacterales bacterium HSG2]
MSVKETLEELFQLYGASKVICDGAKEKVMRGDMSFARRIFPDSSKTERTLRSRDKRDFIDEYFDILKQKIAEHYTLNIIAIFERMVFERIDNTYGEIKNIVRDEYDKRRSRRDRPAPLYHSATAFVKGKDDIRNLSGARRILENQISPESSEELDKIIAHRNWLSHGKREDVGCDSNLNTEEVYEILIKILDEIEDNI